MKFKPLAMTFLAFSVSTAFALDNTPSSEPEMQVEDVCVESDGCTQHTTESQKNSDQPASDSTVYDGPALRLPVAPEFANRDFSKIRQYIELGTGIIMSMKKEVVVKDKPENNETWFQFSVFSSKAAAEAEAYYADPEQYKTPLGIASESGKSPKYIEGPKTKAKPISGVVNYRGDHDEVKLRSTLNDFLDITKTQGSFGQPIIDDLNDELDTDDDYSVPFGDGENFEAGNPISSLGLPQLAVLLSRIQNTHPNAGHLALTVGFQPNTHTTGSGKKQKLQSTLRYQLCQQDPLSGKLHNCTNSFEEPVRNSLIVLFSDQDDQNLKKLVKGDGGSSMWSYMGYKEHEPFIVSDIFAHLAIQVRTIAGENKFELPRDLKDEIINMSYQVSNPVLAEDGVEPVVKSKDGKKVIAFNVKFKPLVIPGRPQPDDILMMVNRKSENNIETIFSSTGYAQKLNVAPAEQLESKCRNSGHVPFEALGLRTVDCIDQLVTVNAEKSKMEQEHNAYLEDIKTMQQDLNSQKAELKAEASAQEAAFGQRLAQQLAQQLYETKQMVYATILLKDRAIRPKNNVSPNYDYYCVDKANVDLDTMTYDITCRFGSTVDKNKNHKYEIDLKQCDLITTDHDTGPLKFVIDSNGHTQLKCKKEKSREDSVIGE
ncbi:hypothetical protein EOPP23_05520 [Endozoicomonas sp. OPT23]|uniref:hypothetical protein n=1 Tax=Endozoicomonas sp. OPT23 TaxID=2072845 RepID=UPI00129B10D1|nr:hypothetical protein [Endozoicomonas sp. OPT23]MRI32443.1 hypothetical protein [Endozoicomonas sp. OPT23]